MKVVVEKTMYINRSGKVGDRERLGKDDDVFAHSKSNDNTVLSSQLGLSFHGSRDG